MFRPKAAEQMTTPFRLLTASYSKVYGVDKKTFEPAGEIFCNFKSKGGTEKTVNNILVIEDTAEVVTWFRPDITSGSCIVRLTDNATFEIINEPENIEMRNQFLKFKVRRIKGGV